jgi:hypothetical protein
MIILSIDYYYSTVPTQGLDLSKYKHENHLSGPEFFLHDIPDSDWCSEDKRNLEWSRFTFLQPLILSHKMLLKF